MVRICIAMPPEKANRKPPSAAIRQSRVRARSRYVNAVTSPIASSSESTRPAWVRVVQTALKAGTSLTGGRPDSASTRIRPMPCSARSQ